MRASSHGLDFPWTARDPARFTPCAEGGAGSCQPQNKTAGRSTYWVSNVGAAAKAVVAAAGQGKPGDAMLPDCKPVKGKVPGPPEHLLCSAHGHVVDIKLKKIVASSIEEYKSKKLGSAKPAAKPAAAGPASVASGGGQTATPAPAPAAPPAAAPAAPPPSLPRMARRRRPPIPPRWRPKRRSCSP